jgi:hypothetical protein
MGSRAVPQGRDRTSVRRMGVAVSVPGFRAAFSTWASERTAYPVEVRESALGHIIGSAVSRAYARSDLLAQRRQPTILAWVRRPEALGVKMRRRVRDDFLDGRGRLGSAPRHRPQRNVPGGVDHRETLLVRLNNPVTYASEAGLDRTDGPPHPT